MLLYERALWFGNCTANELTILAVGLMLSSIFLGLWGLERWCASTGRTPIYLRFLRVRSRRTPCLLLGSLSALCFLCLFVLSLTSYLSPEIVRLAFANGQVDVKLCDGVFEQRRQVASADMLYQYNEEVRGSKQIIDRFLVLTVRGEQSPLGRIDLNRSEVNLVAVRELAPAVARAHQAFIRRSAQLKQ